MMYEVKLAKTVEDIQKCWEALLALRPHLQADTYVALVQSMMQEGYELAYIEADGKAQAAVGFRYLQFLFNGKHIYIDDLSTLPDSRGKGYGSALLDFVVELARSKGYKKVTLDSGYQRNDAHRLYLNKGFILASHHFSKQIE
ncbi:MAG: GNAT family N-acetyltransferase [Spirosomataceae bacterium]